MSYRAWIKPDNGDWLIVLSREWPVSGDALTDAEPAARAHAPCEVLVVHTETKGVMRHLTRRYWSRDKLPKAPIGQISNASLYSLDEPVQSDNYKVGVAWNSCPGAEGYVAITPEQLRQQAAEALDAIKLPTERVIINGRSYSIEDFKKKEDEQRVIDPLEERDYYPPGDKS